MYIKKGRSALIFRNVLIVSGLTKPPKIGVFSANDRLLTFKPIFSI